MTIDEIKALAIDQGCRPFYSDLYRGYVCGCPDNLHGRDPECSEITEDSLARRHARLHERVRDLLMPAGALASRLKDTGAIDLISVRDAKRGSALNKAASRWGLASLILCNKE